MFDHENKGHGRVQTERLNKWTQCFLDIFAQRKRCANVSNKCAKSIRSFNSFLSYAEVSELITTLCFIGKGAKAKRMPPDK